MDTLGLSTAQSFCRGERREALLAGLQPARRARAEGGKKPKKRVLQDPNHKALCSAMHVCITSCRRETLDSHSNIP